MPQYKVIAGHCVGIRKVFKYGDVITELDVRNISAALRGKFVEQIDGDVSLPVAFEVPAPVPDKADSADDATKEPLVKVFEEKVNEIPVDVVVEQPGSFKVDNAGNKRKGK